MTSISKDAIKQLFTEARTHHAWLPKDVSDKMLHEIYDLTKWGPTSANTSPARIVFVKAGSQKEKLLSAIAETNVEKVKAAPVTAISAQDEKSYDQIPKLFPHAPGVKDYFTSNAVLSEATAFRNSTLQGAYFILAARALGLDCGPMSGFNNKKLGELFLAGTSWRSNLICNLGYADHSKVHPRLPRLSFDEACRIM